MLIAYGLIVANSAERELDAAINNGLWISLGMLVISLLLFFVVRRAMKQRRKSAAQKKDKTAAVKVADSKSVATMPTEAQDRAKQDFHKARERIEAKFVKVASESGRPRGLAWVDCAFEDPVSFARDKQSGQLRALVGITIKFEAIEGGGMEHVEAVGNHKAATAVFHLEETGWNTDGRAVFNLSPAQTIAHFQHELEAVK